MLTEGVQTFCSLHADAVFEVVKAKSPLGRPARTALDLLPWPVEISFCLFAKAIEPEGIL